MVIMTIYMSLRASAAKFYVIHYICDFKYFFFCYAIGDGFYSPRHILSLLSLGLYNSSLTSCTFTIPGMYSLMFE